MSHSTGAVLFSDKTVLHCEYNGTVDVMRSNLYKTHEEMHANWRGSKWTNCTCGKPSENVIIATSYGPGFFWPGKACRTCMCITDGWSSDYDHKVKGLPSWYPGIEHYTGRDVIHDVPTMPEKGSDNL
jgi:hypothetical protein